MSYRPAAPICGVGECEARAQYHSYHKQKSNETDQRIPYQSSFYTLPAGLYFIYILPAGTQSCAKNVFYVAYISLMKLWIIIHICPY